MPEDVAFGSTSLFGSFLLSPSPDFPDTLFNVAASLRPKCFEPLTLPITPSCCRPVGHIPPPEVVCWPQKAVTSHSSGCPTGPRLLVPFSSYPTTWEEQPFCCACISYQTLL